MVAMKQSQNKSIIQINQCVDAICTCGCDAVRATIKVMESGQEVAQTATLNASQKELVLKELKAVMSVYDDK